MGFLLDKRVKSCCWFFDSFYCAAAVGAGVRVYLANTAYYIPPRSAALLL